jgi:phage terminase large subunit
MKDFFDILKSHGLYHEENHNMSENVYSIGKVEVEFFSLDEPQKVRGRKRDYLFVNEANELTSEDFFQLDIRTISRIFLDYNPSDIDHWIYRDDEGSMMPRENRTDIHSTFRDNPFLEPHLVKRIEQIQSQDEDYWKIYGLGEQATSKKIIYTNWETVKEIPAATNVFYGLDFGYNDPCALVKESFIDGEVYEEEKLYESGLTNSDLIERLNTLITDKSDPIYADSARPDMIEEILQAGFNIHPSRKGKSSIQDGIDIVKRFKCHILDSSVNLLKEIKSYQWCKNKNGDIIDGKPIDFNNHLMDARRYAIADHLVNLNVCEVLFEA